MRPHPFFCFPRFHLPPSLIERWRAVPHVLYDDGDERQDGTDDEHIEGSGDLGESDGRGLGVGVVGDHLLGADGLPLEPLLADLLQRAFLLQFEDSAGCGEIRRTNLKQSLSIEHYVTFVFKS